jgi:hypothetical protein
MNDESKGLLGLMMHAYELGRKSLENGLGVLSLRTRLEY